MSGPTLSRWADREPESTDWLTGGEAALRLISTAEGTLGTIAGLGDVERGNRKGLSHINEEACRGAARWLGQGRLGKKGLQ